MEIPKAMAIGVVQVTIAACRQHSVLVECVGKIDAVEFTASKSRAAKLGEPKGSASLAYPEQNSVLSLT